MNPYRDSAFSPWTSWLIWNFEWTSWCTNARMWAHFWHWSPGFRWDNHWIQVALFFCTAKQKYGIITHKTLQIAISTLWSQIPDEPKGKPHIRSQYDYHTNITNRTNHGITHPSALAPGCQRQGGFRRWIGPLSQSGLLELLDPLFEIVLMQLSKAFSILIGKVVLNEFVIDIQIFETESEAYQWYVCFTVCHSWLIKEYIGVGHCVKVRYLEGRIPQKHK